MGSDPSSSESVSSPPGQCLTNMLSIALTSMKVDGDLITNNLVAMDVRSRIVPIADRSSNGMHSYASRATVTSECR